MSYYFTKNVKGTFDEVLQRTTAALKREGFGVLTEIDVQSTLKKKIDVVFRPYKILGACNPHLAYKALQTEDKIGTMLPCNVVVQACETGIEVSAVDPMASMMAIENPELEAIANEVRAKLSTVIERLQS